MIHRYFAFFLCLIFVLSLSVSALADGVDGSVTESTVAEPDASPDPVSLSDLNDNLTVIQSLLWFFVVILVCFILWKFFRWFF